MHLQLECEDEGTLDNSYFKCHKSAAMSPSFTNQREVGRVIQIGGRKGNQNERVKIKLRKGGEVKALQKGKDGINEEIIRTMRIIEG